MQLIYTHPFNGPFTGTTQISQYQKGKTNLDFTEARDSEWQWHQLGHMQVCTSLQHAVDILNIICKGAALMSLLTMWITLRTLLSF